MPETQTQESPTTTGRPPKEIDAEQVRQLSGMMLTIEEIAAVLKCSADTLTRRFADDIKKGREEGKASLKRSMFVSAVVDKNATMQIWLSKNILGYTDKTETTNRNINANVTVDMAAIEAMSPDERAKMIRELAGDLKLLPETTANKPIVIDAKQKTSRRKKS